MAINPIFLTDKIKLYPVQYGLVSKKGASTSICFLLVHIPDTPLYYLTQELAIRRGDRGDKGVYEVIRRSDPVVERPYMCFDCAANELMLRAVEAFSDGYNIMIRACELTLTSYSISDELQERMEKHIRKHSGDCLYKAITAHITESANTSTR